MLADAAKRPELENPSAEELWWRIYRLRQQGRETAWLRMAPATWERLAAESAEFARRGAAGGPRFADVPVILELACRGVAIDVEP